MKTIKAVLDAIVKEVRRFYNWWLEQYHSREGQSRIIFVIVSLLIACCLCTVPLSIITPNPTPTPESISEADQMEVTRLVEVEVTRLVEVTSASEVAEVSEVTRIVEVTKLVDRPVTVTLTNTPVNSPTPSDTPTITPTPSNTPIPTDTLIPTSTPTATPTTPPTATPNLAQTATGFSGIAICTKEIKQQGRSEPEYLGVRGFLAARPSILDYENTLPAYPWDVPVLDQTGPDLWEWTGQTLPSKTPVIVLEQHLTHQSHGRYSGYLVVKSLDDDQEYRIDHYNFVPTYYWNCPPHLAIEYGIFVATVTDESVLPINRDGRWEEMGEQKELLCVNLPSYGNEDFVEDGVECLLYKQYRNGFGGIGHIFPSSALKIIY